MYLLYKNIIIKQPSDKLNFKKFESFIIICKFQNIISYKLSLPKIMQIHSIFYNVSVQRASQHSERAIFLYCSSLLHSFFNYSIKKMMSTSNEYQLQFVFQIFEKDFQLSICKVVRLYNILHITLTHCINGRSVCIDIIVNLRKLTALKEEVVV